MADLGEGPLESRLLCGRYLKRSNVKQAANSVTDPITPSVQAKIIGIEFTSLKVCQLSGFPLFRYCCSTIAPTVHSPYPRRLERLTI